MAGSISYDPDGNLISKTDGGATTAYTYDVENRLIAVLSPTDLGRTPTTPSAIESHRPTTA